MNENKKLGWDYITEAFTKLYPNQKPKYYAPIIKARFGGPDPLDGVSIYDAGEFYHFVTYGFSEIDEKENDNKEISGFGFELTFKVKKYDDIDDYELENIVAILQTLAKYVFSSKSIFKPYEYIYTGQTDGIDVKHAAKVVGFVTIEDPSVKTIETVNGKVQFVELIGATYDELKLIIDKIKSNEEVINSILEKFGDITDYRRVSTI